MEQTTFSVLQDVHLSGPGKDPFSSGLGQHFLSYVRVKLSFGETEGSLLLSASMQSASSLLLLPPPSDCATDTLTTPDPSHLTPGLTQPVVTSGPAKPVLTILTSQGLEASLLSLPT